MVLKKFLEICINTLQLMAPREKYKRGNNMPFVMKNYLAHTKKEHN